MTDLFEPTFLPYSAGELCEHFVHSELEGEDPERHLTRWRKRLADPRATNDSTFLHRDETLWTAGAMLGVHRHPDHRQRWRELLVRAFGETSPSGETWDDLLGDDAQVYFEVGLSSPAAYRTWLRHNLGSRHALPSQLKRAKKSKRLEGRTHLDGLLLCPSTGFALHVEAKVLSDIDPKTTHDTLRNQLARNLDCMAALPPSDHEVLGVRKPDRSFLVLLTPELYRRNPHSRLYGHLFREYTTDPGAIHRDLPHLEPEVCASLARRLGWLTFEDFRAVDDAICPWLPK